MVVIVHMGEDDPRRGEAGLAQGFLDGGAELAAAGVEEQAAAILQPVDAGELGAVQVICVPFYLDEFHSVSLSLFHALERSRRSRWIISAATSAGETPEIRPACPRFWGRMALSFCRASRRRPSRAV